MTAIHNFCRIEAKPNGVMKSTGALCTVLPVSDCLYRCLIYFSCQGKMWQCFACDLVTNMKILQFAYFPGIFPAVYRYSLFLPKDDCIMVLFPVRKNRYNHTKTTIKIRIKPAKPITNYIDWIFWLVLAPFHYISPSECLYRVPICFLM